MPIQFESVHSTGTLAQILQMSITFPANPSSVADSLHLYWIQGILPPEQENSRSVLESVRSNKVHIPITHMYNFLLLLGTAFWIGMLIDCYRNEPERTTWGLLILFFYLPAALIYGLVRFLPRHVNTVPFLRNLNRRFLNRWTRKSDLWQAEAAVRHIGKEQQYLELARIQYNMSLEAEAQSSYQTALEQSPKNPHILWEIANFEIDTRHLEAARTHLQDLLQIDPQFRYGDASTLYGKVLIDLEEEQAAREHLETHTQRWSNPEAMVMLAELQVKTGETAQAQQLIDTMIANLRGGPEFHRKRNRHFMARGERLLRQIRS